MSFLFDLYDLLSNKQLHAAEIFSSCKKTLLRSNVWKQKSWESLVDFSLGCWAHNRFLSRGCGVGKSCEADVLEKLGHEKSKQHPVFAPV